MKHAERFGIRLDSMSLVAKAVPTAWLLLILACSLFAQPSPPSGDQPSSGDTSSLDRRVRELEHRLAQPPKASLTTSFANGVKTFVEAYAELIPALGSLLVIPFARRMLREPTIATDKVKDLAELSTLPLEAFQRKAYYDILDERRAIARRSMFLSSVGVFLILIGASVAFFQPTASAVTAGAGVITTAIGTLFGKRQVELDKQVVEIMKQIAPPSEVKQIAALTQVAIETKKLPHS